MFVDDDEIHNFVMESYIKHLKLDANPSFFSDSKKALDLLDETPKEHWPDIIILDLKMPLLDGFDFVKHLQIYHPELNKHTFLIVLTASISPVDEEEIKKFRVVDEYFIKPIIPKQLKNTINNCLAEKMI